MKGKLFLRDIILLALLFNVLGWGCKKSEKQISSTTPNNPKQAPKVEYVIATISGRIVDVNKHPIRGADIHTAFASTSSDVNGQFIFTNTQIDKNAAYIFSIKEGYFNGSKTIQINAGSSNYVEIQLITKNQSGQFTASTSGIVTISKGASIAFAANSITESATGIPYSGTVNVSAFYIDPSASGFTDILIRRGA